jgi:hypothetical protein
LKEYKSINSHHWITHFLDPYRLSEPFLSNLKIMSLCRPCQMSLLNEKINSCSPILKCFSRFWMMDSVAKTHDCVVFDDELRAWID